MKRIDYLCDKTTSLLIDRLRIAFKYISSRIMSLVYSLFYNRSV